jgi:putative tryptophan/tyrosine transport system substrate-binding protein
MRSSSGSAKPGIVVMGRDDTIAPMSEKMSRRVFITAGAAVAAAPLVATAQHAGRVYTVGTLSLGSGPSAGQPDWWLPFIESMRELGYVSGRNLVLKRAAAEGQADRLPALAQDLVRANVDVIVTTSWRETRAAKEATSTIPIVMTFAPDPVGQGLVASLARPGGNVTGFASLVPGLRQKYVELLKEAVPSASRFALVATSIALVPENLREFEAAAKGLRVILAPMPVRGPTDFEPTLARARKDGASGIIATSDAVTLQHRHAFVRVVQKHRLPAIYWTREYVDVGGLMTYSANLVDLRQRTAGYVDRIFKGAKPADLPVEQPTKFDLVINRKAAEAIGLTLPPSLVLRADEVIE